MAVQYSFRHVACLVVLIAGTVLWGSVTTDADEPQPKPDAAETIKALLEEIAAEQAGSSDEKANRSGRNHFQAEQNDNGVEEQNEATELDGDRHDELPQVIAGRFSLPALRAVSTSTKDVGNGSVPAGLAKQTPRPMESLPESGADRATQGEGNAGWSWTVARWEAANTFSNPRYFEDRMLERHGHQRWGHLQPVVSGARFFGSVAMLPYLMSISPPCDCEYTLGYYRSGACAPRLFQRPPWDRKAILTESAAVATGMLIVP